MVRWVVGLILHEVDPLGNFSFQPVLHDWCNKGRGMCYPVCGMVHIKEPLLLMDNKTNYFQNGFLKCLISKFYVGSHFGFGARCSSVGRAFARGANGSSDRSFMVSSLGYFSFQPMFHEWCNKGRGMCYPVYGMMHIKEPLLLIGKSSPCCASGFPLSLSEWTFTIIMSDAI